MTATEKLRRMLDERGVEWNTFSVSNTEYIHWTSSDGHWCAASIGGPLSLHVNILSATPEQAIAATLGAGTCKTCAHGHMTIDHKHCKWCDIMATHSPDDDRADSPNGYDPEPYFDADFFCGNYERKADA